MQPLELATKMFCQGSREDALELLENQLLLEPDNGRLWELRGLVLRSLGNFPLACDSLEQAALLVPLSVSGQVALAECLLRIGHPSVAICIAEHIVRQPCRDWSHFLCLAQTCNQAQRPDLSARLCQAAIDEHPECHQAHYDLGFYLGRLAQPRATVEAAARRAIALAPDVANYRVGLASLLWQQGDFEHAFSEASKLTIAQLQQLACGCCLRRLVKIFWSAEAFERCQICVDRLQDLGEEFRSTESEGC